MSQDEIETEVIHNDKEALALRRRIAELEQGRVRMKGALERIAAANHTYTPTYLASIARDALG